MAEAGLSRMPRPACSLAVLALAVACAAQAHAQTAAAGGGLAPVTKTREELLREWDLNSDGSIDSGEAEVAASRMRRERARMRLDSGIDPVTGLPRGESPLAPDVIAAEVAPERAEAEPRDDAKADRRESKPLPGTRAPVPALPKPGTAAASPKAQGGKPGPGETRAEADRRRQPVMGGVRGGGLPARAGYGASVPAPPLNAGLPIAPKTRDAAAPATQPRAGLVPRPRSTPTPARSRDLYDPY